MKRLMVVLFAVVFMFSATTVFAAPAVKQLSILWAQWDPADYLQQLCKMLNRMGARLSRFGSQSCLVRVA